MSKAIIAYGASVIFLLCIPNVDANEADNFILPKFKTLRAEENYDFLAEKYQSIDSFLNALKYIPLSENSDSYLTIGGEFRPRLESYTNQKWVDGEDNDFYSHRVALHANARFNQNFRTFIELYHGYTSHEKVFAEYDNLDWHQGFVEYNLDISQKNHMVARVGRQEIGLGSARLVGIREGPNIRRSFDAVRILQSYHNVDIQYLYGQEVKPAYGSFDNRSNIFDDESNNPALWGIYSQFSFEGDFGKNELYFLTFDVNNARFNDVKGEERRHTVGLRRFGNIGHAFSYNTEVMYQFGDLAGNDIKAFNVETDWYYHFKKTSWKPKVGLKLEWSSGDNKKGDGEVNTFNPMFVNPAYYSLAKTVTPANMVSIHPSITLFPTENMKFYLEWALFKRESTDDGLYRPTRFFSREGNSKNSKDIGSQLGLNFSYQFNRFTSFVLEMSYFKAGSFLEQTGDSANIFHVSPTFRFRF